MTPNDAPIARPVRMHTRRSGVTFTGFCVATVFFASILLAALIVATTAVSSAVHLVIP